MGPRHREVVVTGASVCCHMGDDLEGILRDIRRGRNTPFQPYREAIDYGARCQIAGAYPNELDPSALGISKTQVRFMGRASLLALRAARIALDQSGIDPRGLAIAVGSGTGDVATHREICERLRTTGSARRVSPTATAKLMASTVSANLESVLGSDGPSMSASAACAGGPYNVIIAAGWIEHGIVDAAIAGGVETEDIHFFASFDSMRAYNGRDNDRPDRASRPYAEDRNGFIFSEGAGIVVLEARESAESRGAPILGVLRGYGMSSDGAGEMVVPSSAGARTAMSRALEHAGVDAGSIDYINTHATSTPVGDVSEVRAIRSLFGDRRVAYSSTKGYTGHPISASGAIEAVFTLAMLREGWIAPCVNADPLDPELADYPPVLEPMDRTLSSALSNSFGFGGTNACLVLQAP